MKVKTVVLEEISNQRSESSSKDNIEEIANGYTNVPLSRNVQV